MSIVGEGGWWNKVIIKIARIRAERILFRHGKQSDTKKQKERKNKWPRILRSHLFIRGKLCYETLVVSDFVYLNDNGST